MQAYSALVNSNSELSLTEASDRLCGALGADHVEFLDASGRSIHRRTLLRNAAVDALLVSVPISHLSGGGSSTARSNADPHLNTQSIGDVRAAVASSDSGQPVDFNEEFFVKEFDRLERNRLERNRGLMWAGFVVQQLLPGLGFGPFESKQVLRQLAARGIVVLEKHPNPKNPDHPTTCVRLNRENARVRSILQGGNGNQQAARIKVRGEPVSETIIRERR